MSRPTYGRTRAARVVALGGSSMLLAAGAHLVGGGMLPSATVLAVVGLIVGLLAATVTVRRCRLPLLLAVLGVQQVLLHYVFTLFSTVPLTTVCGADPPVHHTVALSCQTAAGPAAGLATGGMGQMGWAMLAGHALAVVATAWLLARGEAWLWRVADRIVVAATVAPAAWPSGTPRVPAPVPVPVPAVRHTYAPAAPRGPPPV